MVKEFVCYLTQILKVIELTLDSNWCRPTWMKLTHTRNYEMLVLQQKVLMICMFLTPRGESATAVRECRNQDKHFGFVIFIGFV